MKNFIDNILDFDEFENAFSLLYEEVRLIWSKYIWNSQFEEVEDEYCTE